MGYLPSHINTCTHRPQAEVYTNSESQKTILNLIITYPVLLQVFHKCLVVWTTVEVAQLFLV